MILTFYLTSCKPMKVYSFVIMDVFRLMVFVFLLKETKGDNFYISPGPEVNWTSATSQCNLAEPDLIFSSNKIKINISIELSTETQLWTGYYAVWTAIEYFGCTEKSNYVADFQTKGDPMHCFSACSGSNIIGQSGHECFCFKTNEVPNPNLTKKTSCDRYCDERKDILVVCGGRAQDHDDIAYISLYKSIGPEYAGVSDIKDANFGKHMCMYYENKTYKWDLCSEEYPFICEQGDSAWVANNFGKYDWRDGTNECFEDNATPSSYNNTKFINSQESLWTGVIRRPVTHKYSIDQGKLSWAFRFGFLRLNNRGKIILDWGQFVDSKLVLCVNNTSPSSTTTIPTTSETSETSTESASVSGATETSTHTMIQAENKKGPSNSSIIVGATVPAVVVIVIVIVAVVLFLRRRGNNEKQPQHHMSVHHNNAYAMSVTNQNRQNIDSQEEYADIDMTSAATGDEPESDYAHDYFVLEKTDTTQDSTTDGRVKRADQSASNPYNNSGYEDGPYDTTEGVNQKPHEAHFNPYNHLGGYEEESSNYDHIGKNKNTNVGRFTTDAENTYNKTNIGYLKNSTSNKLGDFEKENPDYDHIGNDKAGNAASRTMADVDNTYNKTNLGFLKTSAGTSDNIYNVTNNIDPDDTYSHINGRKKHLTGLKTSESDYDTFKK